jgi:hypothetical protein
VLPAARSGDPVLLVCCCTQRRAMRGFASCCCCRAEAEEALLSLLLLPRMEPPCGTLSVLPLWPLLCASLS